MSDSRSDAGRMRTIARTTAAYPPREQIAEELWSEQGAEGQQRGECGPRALRAMASNSGCGVP